VFTQPSDGERLPIVVERHCLGDIPIVVSDHVPDGSAFVVSFDSSTGRLNLQPVDTGELVEQIIPPENPPPAADDILDRIDAAIEERCACGCSRPLHPNGPSGFFASQDCQARWHARLASDPHDVYERDDAAAVYVGSDDEPVPLLGIDCETPDTLAPGPDNDYRTACRRECPHCMRGIAYQAYLDDDDTCDRPSDECRVYVPPERCPRCHIVLQAERYVAAVHDHGPILLFELFDGITRTHRRMPARRLQRAPDRQHLIDLTWEIMRRDLDRFTESWLGQATFPVIAQVTDPRALFRNIGLA
jgi:hypothetical protein